MLIHHPEKEKLKFIEPIEFIIIKVKFTESFVYSDSSVGLYIAIINDLFAKEKPHAYMFFWQKSIVWKILSFNIATLL